jgi:hypothetical protein
MRKILLLMLLATTFPCLAADSVAVQGAEMANAELEKIGSPYRWVVGETSSDGSELLEKQLVGLPCVTAADPTLIFDTLSNIGTAESQLGGLPGPSLVETRCVASNPQGIVIEIWVVRREDKLIPYVVYFQMDPAGGVDVNIRGPW